jgi:ABC-2 type transport system permease protein
LAAAYTAIGLYISARSENQIVSLLLSALLCGLFLLIGSDAVTSLFNSNVSEVLKLVGCGSRFQSITRGVIDFRDLYYYVSVAGVFLSLNVLGLEKLRWSGNRSNPRHSFCTTVAALSIANFIAGNFWLQQVGWARVDMTQGHVYSISSATRNYLSQLQEPLIIRGYFSKKTHQFLSPLVPQVRDLLKEYAIAGKGKVHVEFVDPQDNPELEKEANEKYGIKPVTFQTSSKYQAALTNSYFDILIKYGDQFEKLGFRDLIDVKARNESDVAVELRNPEYDITSAIKKVLYAYQGGGNLFLGMEHPVSFTGYISSDSNLPEPLVTLKKQLNEVLDSLKKDSGGKLSIQFVDPDADNGKVGKQLESTYGFRPMTLGLTDNKIFWFYMVFKSGDQMAEVSLPDKIEKAQLERNVLASLKRFSKGFLKTVGICAPQPTYPQFGMNPEAAGDCSVLKERLGTNYSVQNVSLDDGRVPGSVDLLIVIAPDHLGAKQLFAIDQFLMKGGTVVVNTAPFNVALDKAISCHPQVSGMEDWLKHYGIDIQKSMVLDKQDFQLPIPMHRQVAGYMVEETALVPYPYFIDVLSDGMSSEGNITAGVDHVVVDWASPINVDSAKNKTRSVIRLLQSSKDSWTSENTDIEPKYSDQLPLGFPEGKDKDRKLLAVVVEGSFDSFFKGKAPPPLPVATTATENSGAPGEPPQKKKESLANNVIDTSPSSARIILVASNSFLSDKMMWLASESLGTRYLNPVELVQNTIDWSLQDRDLLSIRGRGHFARTLRPMNQLGELIFEYANYGLALIGLAIVWLIRRRYRLKAQKRYRQILQSTSDSKSIEEVRA